MTEDYRCRAAARSDHRWRMAGHDPTTFDHESVARDVRTATDLIESVVVGRKPLHLICSSQGLPKPASHTSVARRTASSSGAGRRLRRNGFSESRPTCQSPCAHVLWAAERMSALDDPGPIRGGSARRSANYFGCSGVHSGDPETQRNERYRLAGSQRYDRRFRRSDFRPVT